MPKRTRLKKGKSSKNRDRLKKDAGILGVIDEGKSMLKESAGNVSMGISASEFDDEEVELLVKKTKAYMDKHPGKDVMVKIELYTEPGDSAGIFFFVHGEDLVNYDRMQAEDSDTGNIYTIERSNIRRVMSFDVDDQLSLNNPHGMNIAG